jgi:hypothetical protein
VRLIDADALKDEMRAGCVPIDLGGITGITGDDDSIEDYIDAAPTIDAIPVKWLRSVHENWLLTPDEMEFRDWLIERWQKEQEERN